MDIVISERSSTPIYQQIYVQLTAQILDGSLAPGATLPSIRTVARELGISVITVKKAWELLEGSDLIYTRAGKGAFVSEHPSDARTTKRLDLAIARFREDAKYYRNLAITRDELLRIVEQEY